MARLSFRKDTKVNRQGDFSKELYTLHSSLIPRGPNKWTIVISDASVNGSSRISSKCTVGYRGVWARDRPLPGLGPTHDLDPGRAWGRRKVRMQNSDTGGGDCGEMVGSVGWEEGRRQVGSY